MQYEAKIGFDIPRDAGLRVGMSATADIITGQRSNALLVPERAIKRDEQGNSVVMLKIGDKLQPKLVVTGLSDGLQTEIIDGLGEGDTVVIEERAGASSSGTSGGMRFPFMPGKGLAPKK